MTQIILNEHFGPTIQGEGPHMGQSAYFVRTYGCPLGCTFCDTPFSWRSSVSRPHDKPEVYDPKDESTKMSVADLQAILEVKYSETPFNRLVITGGEPLIQMDAVNELLWWHRFDHVPVDIETAGFVEPQGQMYTDDAVSFNVSVKLANSHVDYNKRINPRAINMFIHHPRAIFKFVVSTIENITEIKELQDSLHIPDNKIWIMPECLTQEEHIERQQWVVKEAIMQSWNYSPRLHVMLWGNKRGV